MGGPHEPNVDASAATLRLRLRVRGIVQGVGFRPFVYSLAIRYGLGGFVGNDSGGVLLEVEGPPAALAALRHALTAEAPPLAHVEAVEVEPVPPTGATTFVVAPSAVDATEHTFVSPDQALCADCRRELFDPHDRRYLYPFINCTNCGPRYTITCATPYDRAATTMAGFALCPACRREYEDPANRRFHAQPNACPVCGPHLDFRWSASVATSRKSQDIKSQDIKSQDIKSQDIKSQDIQRDVVPTLAAIAGDVAAVVQAQRVLARGGIVAIKGIGGYHLACDAANPDAVALLRARKARLAKPFAVMAADLAAVHRIAVATGEELDLLTSRARPIVLLRKRHPECLAAGIAPGNGYLGVMLPYTPLHELLFHRLPGELTPSPVLVMTSGNLAEEPIAWQDDEALERLAPLVDAFLLHNRPIETPCDDSVVRVVDGQLLPIRRSRGYAPFPINLADVTPPLLAVGGELKATFCLAQGRHALLSQHIGDLSNAATLEAFDRAVDHMCRLFRVAPEVIACDQHPGYLSTAWAQARSAGRTVIPVQHHHAHIAALLAEHGVPRSADPVIGIAFDGTGYGMDGAIWGGEVLLADYRTFARAAHLRYIPLPGGDTAIKRPYRTALAHLWAAQASWDEGLPAVAACPPLERGVLQHQLATGLNAPLTSSMGRLCDAVAALAGVRQVVDYEAQAAIELEALAAEEMDNRAGPTAGRAYQFGWEAGPGSSHPIVLDAGPVIRSIAADVLAGVAAGSIAERFHAALADLTVETSVALRRQTGIRRVALSGGVFQNSALLCMAVNGLHKAGFDVLTHRRVPPNDGGLALGQAVVAAAQVVAPGANGVMGLSGQMSDAI